MKTQITSNQFWLSKFDLFKGFIVFVGTPVLYLLQDQIPGWNVNPLLKAAISAAVTYLLKNFFDKPKVVITDSATVEGVKDGTIKIEAKPQK